MQPPHLHLSRFLTYTSCRSKVCQGLSVNEEIKELDDPEYGWFVLESPSQVSEVAIIKHLSDSGFSWRLSKIRKKQDRLYVPSGESTDVKRWIGDTSLLSNKRVIAYLSSHHAALLQRLQPQLVPKQFCYTRPDFVVWMPTIQPTHDLHIQICAVPSLFNTHDYPIPPTAHIQLHAALAVLIPFSRTGHRGWRPTAVCLLDEGSRKLQPAVNTRMQSLENNKSDCIRLITFLTSLLGYLAMARLQGFRLQRAWNPVDVVDNLFTTMITGNSVDSGWVFKILIAAPQATGTSMWGVSVVDRTGYSGTDWRFSGAFDLARMIRTQTFHTRVPQTWVFKNERIVWPFVAALFLTGISRILDAPVHQIAELAHDDVCTEGWLHALCHTGAILELLDLEAKSVG